MYITWANPFDASVIRYICSLPGLSVNQRNESGWTAFHYLVSYFDPGFPIDSCEALTDHGGDVNAVNVFGDSVLERYLLFNKPGDPTFTAFVRLMLKSGVDCSQLTRENFEYCWFVIEQTLISDKVVILKQASMYRHSLGKTCALARLPKGVFREVLFYI